MEFKISVVVTVRDDEAGVKRLLADLKKQSVKADEVIIIRAAPVVRLPLPWSPSTRRGVPSTTLGTGHSATTGFGRTSEFFQRKNTGPSEKGEILITVVEAGSDCTRGKGRNIGIGMARNELIAVTDAGCRPRRDWLYKFYKCYKSYKGYKLVIAGWYRAVAETPWQKAFLPYLVPTIKKDKKNKKEKRGEGRTFLPASRSIAFTKKAWALVGGYPEEPVSGGEDLKFADNLYKNPEINIVFEPEALVDWPVPATLEEFIKDMIKHTRGNFEAGYWPHIYRNLSVMARWMVMAVWPWVIVIYFGLEIKNKIKIIKSIKIIMIILTVRVAADAAVVYGTVIGIIDEWVIKKLRLRVSGG